MPGAYAGLIAHERRLPRFERTRKQISRMQTEMQTENLFLSLKNSIFD